MIQFIHDVINDSREYLPFLLMVGAVLLFWAGLCLAGFLSLRSAKPGRKLWCGLVAFLFGLVCVGAEIPFSIEAQGSRFAFDLRCLFFLPVLLGLAGLVLWWRKRPRAVA